MVQKHVQHRVFKGYKNYKKLKFPKSSKINLLFSEITLSLGYKSKIMKEKELNLLNQLEHRLGSGRGISDWKLLIELRKKYLITKGENPNDYVLGNRVCYKKGIANDIIFNR